MKRAVLLSLLGLLVCWLPGWGQVVPRPGAKNFELVKVAEGVYAAIATPNGLATGNAGFIIGDKGVLVVDTFFAPSAAEELRTEIERRTPLPIKYVVNTHYHLDHTGGNQVFAARNIPIIAQEQVRAWLPTRNRRFVESAAQLQQRRAELLADLKKMPDGNSRQRRDLERRLHQTEAFLSLKLTPPLVTYNSGSLRLFLGSREVVLFTLPGHTGGDTLVYVPDANVIFTGDMGWTYTLPNLVDATVSEWLPSLEYLINEYATAQFVPGHGSVASVIAMNDFRDYLVDLRERVQQAIANGYTLDQAQDQLTLPDQYRNFAFQHFAPRNVADMYQELKGQKRR